MLVTPCSVFVIDNNGTSAASTVFCCDICKLVNELC